MDVFRRPALAVVFLASLFPLALFGQTTTGSLVGVVTTEGGPLPGVTVTVSSPSLQGTRTATTGEGGGYHFPALPPGSYTVSFELSGMQPINKRVEVNVSQTSRADAAMRVAAITEALTVTAAAPPAVETSAVTANFQVDTINELPVGRTIRDIVALAPGITDAGPNNQITISGSHSFDSIFLVNGVNVNENLRGQPHDLFIEDAIQETTVLTGGVSAEFGRFTGGVVNTLTKSGGNDFSGSYRDTLTNPSWTKKTPYAAQADPIDELNQSHEVTLGGRLMTDRLWFFTAARYETRELSQQTTQTNIPYVQSRNDRRWEGKLTGQINPQHSLVGSFLKSHNKRDNIVTFGPIVDLRSLAKRDEPKQLLALHYSGIYGQNFLLEGQYSRMDHDLTRGAETRDLIEGTLLRDVTTRRRMWSPAGCGTPCPVKQHDNKNYLIKGSYFLSTRAIGNHSFVGGLDEFHQLRNDSNFQSGSDFRIHGRIIQVGQDVHFGIDPSNGLIEWDPVPALSKTSDFAVRSAYVNDKWDLNEHWHFNVGLRYDQAFGKDQAGTKTVDDSAFSPRLAARYDIRGDGKHRFAATYGRYVSKVDQGPADNTAAAGRYASYYWDYEGPAINPPGTPVDKLIPVPQVIRMVFDWFNSVGGTKNTALLTSVRVPGYTTRFDRSVRAPYMDEWTAGYSMAFGNRGFIRGDYITREWADFYVIRRTIETGKAVDPTGLRVDQGVIENSDDGLDRNYRAVQLQGNYRLWNSLRLGGNYTWSKLRGNVEGETATGATSLTSYKNRPEYSDFAQNNPIGFLAPDMRHRANLWLQYDFNTPVGRLNVSVAERYHSALSYSAVGSIDVRRGTTTGPANGIVNPGYEVVPSSVTFYFSERGAFRVDDITSTDVGVNWYLPEWRGTRLFFEFDLTNALNEDGIEDPDALDQTILTRRSTACLQTGTNTRCLAFNPFTDTPVEGVHWQKGASFGRPVTADAYQTPRTYRLSLGLRF